MLIKTRIMTVSVSLAMIIAGTLGVLYISLEQLSFFESNIEFNTERLRCYMTLNTVVLRSIYEGFDLQQSLGGNVEEIALNSHQLKLAVAETREILVAAAAVNERQAQFFATNPLFLNLDGEAIDNSLEEAGRLRAISGLINRVLLDVAALRHKIDAAQRLAIKHRLNDAIDARLSVFIKAAVDEQQQDVERDNRGIQRFRVLVRNVVAGLVGLAILFLVYLVNGFAGTIVRKLHRLTAVVDEFKQGNYAARVQISGHDELAALGEMFNTLAKEIAGSHAALVTASKMSALGEMAGGIAHEINNPLGVIAGRASQIKKLAGRPSIDVDNIRKFADAIEQMATRIAAIISGLRSFSRNTDKDLFAETQLTTMIQDTLALCAERFKNHGVNIKLNLPPGEIHLECRATQVVQVLVNLLNNAHDAVMDLPEKWVELSLQDDGEGVAISVTDSGHGLSAAVRDKMFQPFFTTKEVGKGTGLGLSISKGLVEDHGGRLVLDDQCAHTRFVVHLPKHQARRAAA